MANGSPETNENGNGVELQRLRDEAKRQIDEAKRNHTEDQLRQELLRQLTDAEKKRQAAEIERLAKHRDGIPDDKKQQAKEVKKTVVTVLMAIKEGIIEPPQGSKEVLSKLAETERMSDRSAASLYGLVDKYRTVDITLSQPGEMARTQFETDFGGLARQDSHAAELLLKSVRQAAEAGRLPGVTPDQVNERLHLINGDMTARDIETEESTRIIDQLTREGMTTQEAAEYMRDWRTYYSSFYNISETDNIDVLKAMYSQNAFKNLVQKKQEEVRAHHPDWNDEKIMEHTSEEVELNIVLTFSKLFEQVDKQPPTEFFSEIITQGFMNSIQTAYQNLSRRLSQLANDAERAVDDEFLKNFHFTKKYSDEAIEAKYMKMSDGEYKRSPQFRIHPLIRVRKGRPLHEFLSSVGLEVQHEFETRQYLHNVRAMFYRGPDKDGFWPKLAHYADEMKSTDIDGISSLPDSHIFMSAYRLYQKFVEEKFAKLDWRHSPSMFSKDMGDIYNEMEQAVLEALMKRFPELNETKNKWRARRAMTMAVGLARGILLTEVEAAAWADPDLVDKDGTPTFRSYYTNDNTPLNGLNPQHTFLRFFSDQGSKGPLLFLPTSNFKVNPFGAWDHRELWNNMKKYQESFLKGGMPRSVDGRPGERPLMEILPNIMNVGSIVTRAGWRTAPAYEGWYTYKQVSKDGFEMNSPDIDVLKTWKALENIGYEVLYDFVGRIPDGLLLGHGAYSEKERDDFFKYIYKKYINPSVSDAMVGSEIDAFLRRVRPDVEREIRELMKQDKIRPDEKEDAIKKEMYRRILYRSLVGVLKDRIPTKFIRIERDRYTKDGKRAWEKLATKLNLSFDEMDEGMKSIALVETLLRQDVSAEMKKHLEDTKDLSTFTGSYVLTEQTIRDVFNKTGDERKLELALKVFRGINEHYLNDEKYMTDFSFKIRNKDAAGYLIDKTFPFALATEELDLSFLAYRASGERVLARATGDIGAAESEVFKAITEIVNQLQPISVAPEGKRDFMPFVQAIKKVQETIQGRINQDVAMKTSYHLASMVIAYFKKDTSARNLVTRWFNLGEKHSLAAEFAGGFTNVWEWDVGTIDKFIFELARIDAIARDPYDMAKGDPMVDKYHFNFKIRGKEIKLGKYKAKRKPDFEFSEAKLRRDFGADGLHIGLEMLNTVIPLILLYLLWKALSEAFKELEGDSKK